MNGTSRNVAPRREPGRAVSAELPISRVLSGRDRCRGPDDHFSRPRRCRRGSCARFAGRTVRAAPSRILGLLLVGFAVPGSSRSPRWALTPPFRPYLPGRTRAGGLFSVALSLSRRDAGRLDLPATMPCGARTFLGRLRGRGRLAARGDPRASHRHGNASLQGSARIRAGDRRLILAIQPAPQQDPRRTRVDHALGGGPAALIAQRLLGLA